ncbi:polysaccharide lyase family 8 super-sandwich domain-containing protein [Oceanivirga salmonicida]|uniref:polysaccharide lyase family 8 super-sandwich domain-containing protein n=1 Tax=Oceanivirga salmonicida TaxID=1769291 RepID=UPI0012E12551|nr:polysaccharide lyase family 8 super-sandwich domain-containing protein [Oceanivirga salmonicida]
MKKLIYKRKEFLLGNENLKIDINFIKKLDLIAKEELEKLNDLDKLNLNEIKLRYKSILEILKVYNTKGTQYYKKENILFTVLEALSYLRNIYYNLNSIEHTNWWHWEIGIPLLLNDIFILLEDENNMKIKEEKQRSLEISSYFQPDPRYSGNNPVAIHPSNSPFRKSLGGNRVDTVKISFLRAVLLDDEKNLVLSLESLKEVLIIKDYIGNYNKGEDRVGFYNDGSFIQHGCVPYNGTYGNVLLNGIAEILYLIKGTKFERYLKDFKEKLLNIIFNSYEPFFYNGAFVDMLNGRAITRIGSSDYKIGHMILNSLILLNESFENKDLENIIEREVKKGFKIYDYLKEETSIYFHNIIEKIIERIKNKDFSYSKEIKICNNMSRIFARNNENAIALSMYSKYIANYESMNGENVNGMYTGDGMYYLYTNDTTYIDYWNKVDMKFIPGTSEIYDDNILENISLRCKDSKNETVNYKNYFITYMYYENWNKKLKSDKYWFYLGNEMIFFELNVKSNEKIYTTLENRKYKKIPKIYIDDEKFDFEVDKIYKKTFKEIYINNTSFKYLMGSNSLNILITKINNEYFIKMWIDYKDNKNHIIWSLNPNKDNKHDYKLETNLKDKILLNYKNMEFKVYSKNDEKILEIKERGGCIE